MNSVQRLLMLVHLLEGAWAGLDAEERLTLVSTILSSTVTPADVDGWVRSIEAGGPAGVDPDLVADVRELLASTTQYYGLIPDADEDTPDL